MKNWSHPWFRGCLFLWGAAAAVAAAAGLYLWYERGWIGWEAGILLASAAVLALGLWCVCRCFIRPLKELHDLVEHWGETPPEDLRTQMSAIDGGARETALEFLRQMELVEEKLESMRRDGEEAALRDAKRSMALEICRSALPQVLREYPSRSHFDVTGTVEQGGEPCCAFYDYFLIDPGLLCVMIGQVPGGGVSEALYMVVAQTTIRSRLRMGRSLAETMADVNTQLYDLGVKQSTSVLVGTLSTADGRFSFVNAGQMLPLLMRNGDRYEWLEMPVYAPLGLNEKVTYRLLELRLRQGDRLFFHTGGLRDTISHAEVRSEEQELRAVLNRSRGKAHELKDVLHFVGNEAAVCCQQERDRVGYAAMLLEYQKGDKELAHCQVAGVPASSQELTAFLKKQFEDNGIQPGHYARVAVLVDEVFSLCCRCIHGPDNTVVLECGVSPDAQSVTLRVTAALGGVDPMAAPLGDAAQSAVDFVCEQVDYVTFKAGDERDVITLVCFF